MVGADRSGNTHIESAPSEYTVAEEWLHAGSHAVGLLLSIAGLVWMLNLSLGTADSWRIAASGIYGISLVSLFLASTLYHGFIDSPHRPLFKLLDHCAINLLIAGSSTPFLLVSLRTDTSWWLFGGMWMLAAAGILSKLKYKHQYPRLSLASYLLMGWLMVIVLPELSEVIDSNGLVWLAASGLSYTVGAGFYAAKRVRFGHAIWHLFVLGGAACSFFAVVWYVLPPG